MEANFCWQWEVDLTKFIKLFGGQHQPIPILDEQPPQPLPILDEEPHDLLLPPRDLLATLPSEMLDNVLELCAEFATTSLISRRLYSQSNRLVRNMCFRPNGNLDAIAYRDRLDRALHRFVNLEKLSFRNCVDVNNWVVQKFVDDGVIMGGTIRELRLDGCSEIVSFNFVVQGCPSLTYLDLSRTSINDQGLSQFGAAITPLQTVVLGSCAHVTDTGIQNLLMGCPTIRKIDISSSLGIMGVGFGGVAAQLEHIIADSCHLDKDLGLTSMTSSASLLSLSMNHVVSANEYGPMNMASASVTCLDMSYCADILDDGRVTQIALSFPRLTEFSMIGCPIVPGNCWVYIAACQYLQSLDVRETGLSGASLLVLQNGCPSLVELRVTLSAELTMDDIDAFRAARGHIDIVVDEAVDELQFILE